MWKGQGCGKDRDAERIKLTAAIMPSLFCLFSDIEHLVDLSRSCTRAQLHRSRLATGSGVPFGEYIWQDILKVRLSPDRMLAFDPLVP
jgi:hypothetical protein